MTWRPACVISIAVLAAVFSFASAASVFDIEYPISELGDCADRLECKAYCNDPNNAEACFEFAKKYGLADPQTEEKINQVKRLAEDLGPGGCNSRELCEEYCKAPDHSEECIDDAVRRGFMSPEEGDRSKKLAKGGPGGCKGDECRTYCDDSAHEDECFQFAAENGFIDKQEAERIRDLKKKFGKQQEGPGGCKGERECRTYCDNPDHTEECVDFAEKNGFMSPEEARRIKKLGLAGGPGGCKGAEECRTYCDNPEHQQECIDFAEREGLMSKDEIARARKFAGKAGPGGCKGERECRAFCENPDNAEMCLAHAEQEDLMPKEEIERARKFLNAAKDGGPGGCKGAQCRDYCENPERRDECFDFAKKQGLIRPEEERQFDIGKKLDQKMKESGGPSGCKTENECRTYCSDPSKVEECVAFASTHAGVSQEDAVALLRQFTEHRFGPPPPPGGPQRDFTLMGPPGGFRRFEEESMRRFDEFRQLEEQFRGGENGFSGRPLFKGEEDRGDESGFMVTGPGGCTSPDECIKYCIEHKDECFNFGPPGKPSVRPPEGGVPPGRYFESPRLRGDLLNEFHQSNQREGLVDGGNTSIRITKDPSGKVKLFIRDPDGIKSFSLELTDGGRYSGDISGCAQDYSSEPSFDESSFPIKASITDCTDDVFETTLQGFGNDRERSSGQPSGGDIRPLEHLQQFKEEFQRQYQERFQQENERQTQQVPFTPLDLERERMMVPLIPEGWVFPPQPAQPQFAPPPDGIVQPPTEGTFQPPPEGSFQLPPEQHFEEPASPVPTSFQSFFVPLASVLFSIFFGN